MVRAGLGLAIVPEAAASLNFSGVKLRPLRLRAPALVELFLVWRREHENPLLPSLIEIAGGLASAHTRKED
jgi:DNA-binding transcriptional LysR family regulator